MPTHPLQVGEQGGKGVELDQTFFGRRVFNSKARTSQMAPSALLQALPYTSAAVSLIGQTFNVEQMKTYEGVAPINKRLVAFVVEVFTVVMICALSADAAKQAGVVRGAIVGGFSATVAYVLPRMYLSPVVGRLCKSCSVWGKTCIGICALLCLFVIMLAFNWIMTA